MKETKISPYVRKHLQLSNCPKIASYCIKIRPYDSIASELSILSKTANAKLWVSDQFEWNVVISIVMRLYNAVLVHWTEFNVVFQISPKVNYALKQDVDDVSVNRVLALLLFTIWRCYWRVMYMFQSKIYLEWSPIRLMKAKKNKVELDGMRKANVRILIYQIPFNGSRT